LAEDYQVVWGHYNHRAAQKRGETYWFPPRGFPIDLPPSRWCWARGFVSARLSPFCRCNGYAIGRGPNWHCRDDTGEGDMVGPQREIKRGLARGEA